LSSQTLDQEVRGTVNAYFAAYEKGDTMALKEVFHKDFHLSWLDPWTNNAFSQVDRKGMFAFFGPEWKNLDISGTIIEIDIDGNAAYCRAKVEIKGIVIWTDLISLLKMNGRWCIVSKVSTGEFPKADRPKIKAID